MVQNPGKLVTLTAHMHINEVLLKTGVTLNVQKLLWNQIYTAELFNYLIALINR